MKASDLQSFRTQLERQRTDLLEQIDAQRGGDVSRADAAAEQFARRDDSDAQVATERDLSFAINEHETAELIAIDAALARMADGSYGECMACGIDIPQARLQASPAVVRCVQCQEKFERQAVGR